MKPLALFFAFGAVMAGLVAAALILPSGPLEWIWSLKPEARAGFDSIGSWGSAALMAVVSCCCAFAAYGLWRSLPWGIVLAQGILVVNLCGDVLNATLRHDARSWIGIPVALALLVYLRREKLRNSARNRTAPSPPSD